MKVQLLYQALKDHNLDKNKPNILQCDIVNCKSGFKPRISNTI